MSKLSRFKTLNKVQNSKNQALLLQPFKGLPLTPRHFRGLLLSKSNYFWLIFGKLLQHGQSIRVMVTLCKTLTATLHALNFTTQSEPTPSDQPTSQLSKTPLFLKEPALRWLTALQNLPVLEVAYRVTYSQLNRKIRKIVKNKYRYQKRYEWIQPRGRPRFVVNLFKKLLQLQPELTFLERCQALLIETLTLHQSSALALLLYQHQTLTVSMLVQTAKLK